MSEETKLIRVHQKFADELDEIKVERIKNGLDKKLKSSERLSLAIIRHSLWKEIKQEIIDHPLK